MRMLLLLMLVAMAAGGESTTPIPGSEWGIIPPSGWTAQTNPLGAALVLRSPAGIVAGEDAAAAGLRERGRGAITVALQPLAASQTAALFAQQCLVDLGRLTSDFTLLEPAAAVTYGGREWQRLRCRFNTGQLSWEQVICVTVAGGIGVCVTCSSDHDRFAGWLATFEAALASLGLRTAPAK